VTVSPRHDGYVPISDYAVLGDGRTAALAASDGRIDWWAIPTLDAPPVCAAILDAGAGGFFSLAPESAADVSRRYLPGTNVLETTYTTPGGAVRVTDALNVGSAGRLPWTELARRVIGVSGEVAMRWEFRPGDRFGQARPWVTTQGQVPVVTDGDQNIALVVHGAPYGQAAAHHVAGTLLVRPGEQAAVAAVATDHEPVVIPPASHTGERLERTIDAWRRWSALVDYQGPWADVVTRSALALKTVLYEPGGAIAAAVTTSLPEAIGGRKNYDYRYAWVRDSSFTVDAFIRLGLREEVHAAVSWLLNAVSGTAPDIHVFYSLDGRVAEGQATIDVPGYRHSRPVRSGNDAAGQSQLGTFGDLFETVARYVSTGHLLNQATGRLMADLADRCCDIWTHEDAGLWELAQHRHYTISKIGCWVALDRAAALADAGQLPAAHAPRWRQEAADIARWVREHCWSRAKRSYTFYAGTDDLDAAVLLAARTGFDRGPRLASTIDAITAELGRGSFVYRYTGMEHEENAFVACTFWLVEALAWTGQAKRAGEVMGEAVGWCSDVGLLSEQIDPASGEFRGNLPQALSHLALINAAHTLAE
jgi:GH15 family glucan-1,4-alpha-glucosidase